MQVTQTYDVDAILSQPEFQVDVEEFRDKDFKMWEAEESINIYRVKRSNYSDPYFFYIQCMAKVYPSIKGMQKFIDSQTKAEHISEEEFLKQVDQRLSELKRKPTFQLKGEFVDAVRFDEEWLSRTFLCETTEEVVFFNWNTSV
jgi:hypothetical protein